MCVRLCKAFIAIYEVGEILFHFKSGWEELSVKLVSTTCRLIFSFNKTDHAY